LVGKFLSPSFASMNSEEKIIYVREVLRLKGIKKSWVAEQLGVSKGTLSNHLSKKPGKDRLGKEKEQKLDEIIARLGANG